MGEKRTWLVALLVVVLIAAASAATSCHSKGSGGELMLTGATDPGSNAFMPAAASPPPSTTQPAPTLQPHGDGTTVATQPLPGDRDGLYGGTVNNAECDREKIVTFLGVHPAETGAFVDALNSDPDLYWSGGHALTAVDIATYLRELTPVVLRLDTRVTNHGFDGTHFTTVQSVFQAGTAVLVDAHGVPRVRGYSGSPVTAPIALAGAPKTVGTPWPGYRLGALAAVHPSAVTITNFVLVDVVTGQAFNRPAGTTGTNDTPHTQPVTQPQAAPTASQGPQSTTGHALQLDIDGTYLGHFEGNCNGSFTTQDINWRITHQGDTLTMDADGKVFTGTLNADGSFSVNLPGAVDQGTFVTEGGRTVMHGTYQNPYCSVPFDATKQ